VNEKRNNSMMIKRKKLTNNDKGLNIESIYNNNNFKLKTMLLRVTMIYALISVFWILYLDGTLINFIQGKPLIIYAQTIERGCYILATSIIMCFLISKYIKKCNICSHKFSKHYQEIQATFGKLSATKDELSSKYDEIHKKLVIIEESEKRYRLALEATDDAIWEIDLINRELFSSDKFNDITGYDKDFITHIEDLSNLVLEEDREMFLNDFKNHINGKTLNYRSSFRIRADGADDKWVLIRGMCLRDKKGIAIKISGSVTDISDQKDFEEKINKLKYYDILTDIPNRKLFINTLENEIIKAKNKEVKHAVLFIDLDNFKEINDTLGHNYGDKLLKNVATLITASIRKGDLVSRVGGDEFFILLRNIKEHSEISKLCERLLKVLDCDISIDNKHVYTSASIGIAVFPSDGDETSILFKNADTAMYSAKYNGKGKYCFFNKSMSDVVARRVQIEKGLRSAIDNNELEIHYQPQIDIINNKIKGFEALLRWNSSELGRVTPAEFIPVAEKSGLIIPIGYWIIKKVCLQNSIWKSKGYLYDTIAINLSAIQLLNDKFEQTLKNIITETKINPKFVELEITESILLKDFDKSVRLLTAIRDLGINIALDDFGTGYSSLSYLKQLPINTLKIDKSFIDNILTNEREKAILDGIVQLAQKIDLVVIAEGAEIKEQINMLKKMGCNQIQGYYFSKPLPPAEIEEKFLKTNWIELYK